MTKQFAFFSSVLMCSILILSCSSDEETSEIILDRNKTIKTETELVIGTEEQPDEHQLGQPIAVRTDAEGNIYIADRASVTVKVFDRDGKYLRSLGGRGRGPGEFQDFEFMELTPEGHLVFMDRGRLHYIIIDKNGEQVAEYPYNLSDQFHPAAIRYVDGEILSLFLYAGAPSESPVLQRELFHVYSTDFQRQQYAIAPFSGLLNYDEVFTWVQMVRHLGSFTVSETEDTFFYSPGIYNGKLYKFAKDEKRWRFSEHIRGVALGIEPYKTFSSEAQFQTVEDRPGSAQPNFGGETHRGEINSMDAGVFWLENGKVIQFVATWNNNSEMSEQDNYLLDIYAQIFDKEGNVEDHGYLFSVERSSHPYISLVNWKDDKDRFYLLDLSDEAPTVRRFSLNL